MPDMESNDRLFSKIMQKSRLEMPYSDFEDNVMQRIQQELKYKQAVSKDSKLSLVFFLLGTGFGLILNMFLSRYPGTFFGLPSERILLYFQIAYILVVMTQLDALIKLMSKLKNP